MRVPEAPVEESDTDDTPGTVSWGKRVRSVIGCSPRAGVVGFGSAGPTSRSGNLDPVTVRVDNRYPVL